MIGRAIQSQRVAAAVAAAESGLGSAVIVSGESGVGKSFFAQTMADLAVERGWGVARGRCFADAGGGALAPWREALGDQGGKVETRLDSRDDLARSFESVLADVSRRLAANPLLLLIDDLQWADPDSLRLFRHVVRFGLEQRVLLLGTVRSPDLDGARNLGLDEVLAELARDDRCVALNLRPFTEEESAAFIATVAGGEVPQAIARIMAAETGGNPLYLRELTRHLVEEGKLFAQGGRLVTDFALSELGLPPSLRPLVRQRVRRLREPAGELLRRAALLTGSFDAATLATAADLPTSVVVEALDQARAAGLVRSRDGRNELAHAIVKRAIAEEWGPEQRAHEQLRLATALAAFRPEEHAEIASLCHAARALPGSERGIPHARTAAETAVSLGAHGLAASFFQMAADLAYADPPTASRMLAKAAVACAATLDVAATISALDRALAALGDANEARGAEVLAAAARELALGGTPRDAWSPMVNRALSLLGDRRDPTWAKLQLLTRRLLPVIEGPIAISRFQPANPDAIRILRQSNDERDFAASLEPHDSRTPDETADLRTRVRSWQDPAAILRARDICARDSFFRTADFHGARAEAEELCVLAMRIGSPAFEVAGLVIAGCCAAVLGDLSKAREAATRSGELGRRLGSMHRLHLVGPLALATALAYLVQSDPSLLETLDHFLASSRAGSTPFSFVALNLALVAAAAAADHERASVLFPVHLQALAQLPQDLNEWAAGRDCGAAAAFALGAKEHAEAYLAFAQASLDSPACACWSHGHASAARMVALLGRLHEATPLFERARQELIASGRRPIAAIIDHDEAAAWIRVGAGSTPALHRRLESALGQFRAFGMQRWIDSALRLQASLDAPLPDGLSPREVEVLRYLASGLANKEIASRLSISVATVERHIATIYGKTGARGRAAATAYAIRRQLVSA